MLVLGDVLISCKSANYFLKKNASLNEPKCVCQTYYSIYLVALLGTFADISNMFNKTCSYINSQMVA